jgi:hypothetical protein
VLTLGGEREWQGRDSRSAARRLFLDAVQKCEPKVRSSLRTKPFVAFQQLVEKGEHNVNISEPLKAWLRRWHLPCPPEDDRWCFEWAMQTMHEWEIMHEWHVDPRNIRGYRWAPPEGSPGIIDPEQAFRFELTAPIPGRAVRPLDGWNPEYERKANAARRISGAFSQALKAYIDKLDRAARERGNQRTPTKRERAHFEWLVRFQVKGESFADIAAGLPHITSKAVERAVRRTAKLVGIPLRPLKRTGRPAGRVESHPRASRRN